MKKILIVAFIALCATTTQAQTGGLPEVTVAYALDSINNPVYGDIFLMDDDEEVPFYIIVDDSKPVSCNKFKVKAFYLDYVNGKSTNDYWVYQGEFEFDITPNYYGYWVEMNARTTGLYKMEVSGYMNGNFVKYFGSTDFTVYDEDDYWDFGWNQ